MEELLVCEWFGGCLKRRLVNNTMTLVFRAGIQSKSVYINIKKIDQIINNDLDSNKYFLEPLVFTYSSS